MQPLIAIIIDTAIIISIIMMNKYNWTDRQTDRPMTGDLIDGDGG